MPHRPHHVLCSKNGATRGQGKISDQSLANAVEARRLKKLFNTPLAQHEKCGLIRTQGEIASFFAPRTKKLDLPTTKEDSIDFCKAVSTQLADPTFAEKHKSKNAPLAMIAFANTVIDNVVNGNKGRDCESKFDHYFHGITMTVPPSSDAFDNPQYHSIIGQKLLYVDWKQAFGVNAKCPDSNCKSDRRTASGRKLLQSFHRKIRQHCFIIHLPPTTSSLSGCRRQCQCTMLLRNLLLVALNTNSGSKEEWDVLHMIIIVIFEQEGIF